MGGSRGSMRGLLLVWCVIIATGVNVEHVVGVVEMEEGAAYGACAGEVSSATAKCQARLSKVKAAAHTQCGGKKYSHVKSKIDHLKQLATQQEEALKKAEATLKTSQQMAKKLAGASKGARAKLLAELNKQKASKKIVTDLQKKAANERKDFSQLRRDANAAEQKAVDVASTTSDLAKVGAAKDAAHKAYSKMVDEKVNVAAMNHKVTEANKALTKVSQLVEKEIVAAKKVANKEAMELKKVAKNRADVANAKLQEAQYKSNAAATAMQHLAATQKLMKSKVDTAKSDAADGKKIVVESKKVEDAATKAKEKAQKAKIKAGPLALAKLREEAKKLGAAGKSAPAPTKPQVKIKHSTSGGAHHVNVFVHSQGVKQSVHNQYASEVKRIEVQRQQANSNLQAEQAKLAALKSSNGAPAAIAAAQQAVNTASANLKRVTAQQKQAVQSALSAVQKSKNP